MSGPCWSKHGAFRAAFLARLDSEDRPVLQRAGAILAAHVLCADAHNAHAHDEPFLLLEFRAALEDARMLREYLRQIAEESAEGADTEAEQLLAREAWHWHRVASDLAHGMAASLQDATGEWPEEPGIEPAVEAAEVGFESAAPAGAAGDLTAAEARPHLAALGQFLAALGLSLGEVAARMGRTP